MSEQGDFKLFEPDISGVQPRAQNIVRRIAWTCHEHLGPDLVTLVTHGSAVKGGVIEGSSDVDFVAVVTPGILTPGGELPLDRALRFHRNLAQIDPFPFRYLQGCVYPNGARLGMGFIPGTFHIVAGSPDVPIATGEQLFGAAQAALREFDPTTARDRLSNALLDHGEGRLSRQVRLLCTDVWPIMYHVACVYEAEGLKTWQRTKRETVSALESERVIGPPLGRWMEAITHHYSTGESVHSAIEAITSGVAFLDAVADWRQARCENGV